MSQIIDNINREFKAIFNQVNETDEDAKQMVEDVNKQFMEQGCYLLGKKPFPVFVKPVFITEERINYVAHVTNVLMSAWEKVTDLYYTEPEVREIFELKPEEIK